MKLFVSYRRKSWPFTSQLVNNLRRVLDADIFVDYQSVDETDFEKSILRHLRASDAVLLIVSEYTFLPARIQLHEDWVRREIREAIALNKPIVAVFIDGQGFPADLPSDIRDIRRKQGVSFYPEYFAAGVKRLADFIIKATPIKLAPVNDFDDDDEETEDAFPLFRGTLVDAIRLLEEGDFDKAIFVLEELRDGGYSSQFVSILDVLTDAQRQRDYERHLQEARLAYADIAALAKSKITRDRARAAWVAFQKAYPDFREDGDHLVEKLSFTASPEPTAPTRLIVPPATREIGEIIVSGSDRSPEALSLDEVLNYFVDSPLNLLVISSPIVDLPAAPAPAPHAKKRDPADRARATQEVRRRR